MGNATAPEAGLVWLGPISIKCPKLVVPSTTTDMTDVPVLVMLPLARGLAATGRTRRFCHVNEQVTPFLLVLVMSNRICVEVRDAMAAGVPLAPALILLTLAPAPPRRSILTVGAVPPVSKTNPLGAFRMIVPVLTSALALS